MNDTPARMLGLVCVLLGMWIVAYWLYTPSAARRVSFDEPTPVASTEPAGTVAPAVQRAAPEPARGPVPQVPSATPAPLPAPAPAATPTRRVRRTLPPEFREYVVQKGDVSFERIAARKEVYGDARRAKAVAQANPLVDPGRLKPGQTRLRIAVDPDNIQGKEVWVDEPVTAVDTGGAAPPAPASERPAPAGQTYTITGEDTMWGIAERFYGKGSRWKAIYDANRDLIPDPDRPPRGVTIRIPPE